MIDAACARNGVKNAASTTTRNRIGAMFELPGSCVLLGRRAKKVVLRSLTFELTALARTERMYRVPQFGPRWPAVAGPVERGVRPHCHRAQCDAKPHERLPCHSPWAVTSRKLGLPSHLDGPRLGLQREALCRRTERLRLCL